MAGDILGQRHSAALTFQNLFLVLSEAVFELAHPPPFVTEASGSSATVVGGARGGDGSHQRHVLMAVVEVAAKVRQELFANA